MDALVKEIQLVSPVPPINSQLMGLLLVSLLVQTTLLISTRMEFFVENVIHSVLHVVELAIRNVRAAQSGLTK